MEAIQYGDVVTIYDRNLNGWVSASSYDNFCRFDSLDRDNDHLFPPNLQDCRFQIHRQYKYSAHKNHKKLLISGRLANHEAVAQELAEEQATNEVEMESCKGRPLTYGSIIQLKHVTSGLFLNAMKALAIVEMECLRVQLGKGCTGSWWEVLPVYKFRRLGDSVHYKDAVCFRSVTKRSGYLHISDVPCPSATSIHPFFVAMAYELNCDLAEGTRLQFLPYRNVAVHEDRRARPELRAGDTVCIKLPEHEALLTGSCQDRDDIRFLSSQGSSVNANSLWTVENESAYDGGKPLAFDRPSSSYRLRHVVTHLHLKINMDQTDGSCNRLSLTDDYSDPGCKWTLERVLHNKDTLIHSNLTPIFLKHAHRDLWLHSLKSQPVCQNHHDQGQYLQLVDHPIDCYTVFDDLRVIVRLIQNCVDQVNISGSRILQQSCMMMSMTRSLSMDYSEPEDATAAKVQGRWDVDILDALRRCIEIVAGPEANKNLLMRVKPNAAHQTLCLDFGLISAVIQLIVAISDIIPAPEKKDEGIPDNCHMCVKPLMHAYTLLRHTCTDNHRIKRTLAPHLPMMIAHQRLRVLSEDCMRCILHADKEILLDLQDEHLQALVDFYVESRRASPLKVLKSLCECNGDPIPHNQRKLAAALLDHPESLPRITGSGNSLRVLSEDADPNCLVLDPRKFRSSEESDLRTRGSKDPEAFLLRKIVNTIDLFASLCLGRNKKASQRLSAPSWGLSQSTLMGVVRDFYQPSSLRQACLRLVHTLYLDQEPHITTPIVTYTRCWSEAIDAKKQAVSLGRWKKAIKRVGLPLQYSKIAGKTASKTVSDEEIVQKARETTSDKDVIQDVVGVFLELAKDLAQHYKLRIPLPHEDQKPIPPTPRSSFDFSLLRQLLQTLHGLFKFKLVRNDVASSLLPGFLSVLDLPNVHPHVETCKLITCESCLLRMDVHLDESLETAFAYYEKVHRKSKTERDEGFATLADHMFGVNGFEKAVFDQFVNRLQRLTDPASDSRLRLAAFKLFQRYCGEKAYTVQCLSDLTVLTTSSAVTTYALAEEAHKLFLEFYPLIVAGSRTAAQEMICLLEEMTFVCTPKDEKAQDGANEQDVSTSKNVAVNKDMLRNLGFHDCVFRLLTLPLKRVKSDIGAYDIACDPVRRDLFNAAYGFLATSMKDNEENQEYQMRYVFAHDKSNTPLWQPHVGVAGIDNVYKTITESIRDNLVLSLQVKDIQIRKVVQTIAKYGKHEGCLDVLAAAVECKGKPLKRNQNLVLAALLEEQGELVLELDGCQGGLTDSSQELGISTLSREGYQTRYQLMASAEHLRRNSFLQYHAKCIQLLADCCKGQNLEAQQKCKNLLPIGSIIDSIIKCNYDDYGEPFPGITNDTIRFVRSPFINYLRYVYCDSRGFSTDHDDTTYKRIWSGSRTQQSVMASLTEDVKELASRLREAFEDNNESGTTERTITRPRSLFTRANTVDAQELDRGLTSGNLLARVKLGAKVLSSSFMVAESEGRSPETTVSTTGDELSHVSTMNFADLPRLVTIDTIGADSGGNSGEGTMETIGTDPSVDGLPRESTVSFNDQIQEHPVGPNPFAETVRDLSAESPPLPAANVPSGDEPLDDGPLFERKLSTATLPCRQESGTPSLTPAPTPKITVLIGDGPPNSGIIEREFSTATTPRSGEDVRKPSLTPSQGKSLLTGACDSFQPKRAQSMGIVSTSTPSPPGPGLGRVQSCGTGTVPLAVSPPTSIGAASNLVRTKPESMAKLSPFHVPLSRELSGSASSRGTAEADTAPDRFSLALEPTWNQCDTLEWFVNYVFNTVLPCVTFFIVDAQSQTNSSRKVPEVLVAFANAAADCNEALQDFANVESLAQLDAIVNNGQDFFAALRKFCQGVPTTFQSSFPIDPEFQITLLHGWQMRHKERFALQSSLTVEDLAGSKFKDGFKAFISDFANSIGIDSRAPNKDGLLKVARVFSVDEPLMENLCLALRDKPDDGTAMCAENRLLILQSLRCFRAFVCCAEASQESWDAFARGRVPSDFEGLNKRQHRIANLGVVQAAIRFFGQADVRIAQEALMLLEVLLGGNQVWDVKENEIQDEIVNYMEAHPQQFQVMVKEMLQRADAELRVMKKLVQKRQEHREAMRNVEERIDSGSFSHTSSSLHRQTSSFPREPSEFAHEPSGFSHVSTGQGVLHGRRNSSPYGGPELGEYDEYQNRQIEVHNIKQLLVVLGLMCAGHHTALQDKMYPSAADRQRVNLFTELVTFLLHLEGQFASALSMKNKRPLEIAIEGFNTLTCMVSGNVDATRVLLLEEKLLETIQKYFARCSYGGIFDDTKQGIRLAILDLMMTILQQTPSNIPNAWFATSFTQALQDLWTEVYDLYEPATHSRGEDATTPTEQTGRVSIRKVSFEFNLGLDREGFRLFHMLCTLKDYSDQVQTRFCDQIQEHPAYQHYAKHSADVEVIQKGVMSRVRFRRPEVCLELETQERFKERLETIVWSCLGEVEDKARGQAFHDQVTKLVSDELKEREVEAYPVLGYLLVHENRVHKAPFILTIMLNFLLVTCESLFYDIHQEYIPRTGWLQTTVYVLIRVLGLLHLVATGVRMLYVYLLDFYKHMGPDGKALERPLKPLLFMIFFGGLFAASYILFGWPWYCLTIALGAYMLQSPVGRFALVLFLSNQGLILFIYFVCSILANFTSHYFFAVHMIALLNTEPVALLLKAATGNVDRLSQTGLVIALTVYLYSVVGYAVFQHTHDPGTCTTLLNCVVTYMEGGLSGEGLGDALTVVTPWSVWEGQYLNWLLKFLQVSFLVITGQVLLAIAQGLIIDSFGQIRDQRSELVAKRSGSCFICGLERSAMEMGGVNFEDHVNKDHCWTSYVEFIVFLRLTPRSALLGVKKDIQMLVEQCDASWIPYQRCLQMDVNDIKTRDNIQKEQRIQYIIDNMDKMMDRIASMEAILREQSSHRASFTQPFNQASGTMRKGSMVPAASYTVGSPLESQGDGIPREKTTLAELFTVSDDED